MKKFFITILAVLYLGVSSGASLQFHYCMGRLVEWGLQAKNSKKCDKCGMKKSDTKKCCKTSQTDLKIEKSQKVSQSDFSLKAFPLLLSFISNGVHHQSLVLERQVLALPFSNAPPGINNTPAFILHRNFRI